VLAHLAAHHRLDFALPMRYLTCEFFAEENMSKAAEQLDNVMDNIPFYDKWQLGEGLPIIKTFFVQDLKKVELKP
jgi:hypothetical protein